MQQVGSERFPEPPRTGARRDARWTGSVYWGDALVTWDARRHGGFRAPVVRVTASMSWVCAVWPTRMRRNPWGKGDPQRQKWRAKVGVVHARLDAARRNEIRSAASLRALTWPTKRMFHCSMRKWLAQRIEQHRRMKNDHSPRQWVELRRLESSAKSGYRHEEVRTCGLWETGGLWQAGPRSDLGLGGSVE